MSTDLLYEIVYYNYLVVISIVVVCVLIHELVNIDVVFVLFRCLSLYNALYLF